MEQTLQIGLTIAASLLLLWLVLVATLLLAMPRVSMLRELARILPDTLRLLRALHRSPKLPRGARLRLWLLLAYLALPLDLIPDFVPVLGQVDDAILIVVTLRSVLRLAGPELVSRHWPGSQDGLEALLRLSGSRRGRAGPGLQDESRGPFRERGELWAGRFRESCRVGGRRTGRF